MNLQESKNLIEKLDYCYNRIINSIDDKFIYDTIELVGEKSSGIYNRNLRFKSEIWYATLSLIYSKFTDSLNIYQINVIFDEETYKFINDECYLSKDNRTISGYNFKLKECMITHNNQLTLVSTINSLYDMDIPTNYKDWNEEILTLVRLSF